MRRQRLVIAAATMVLLAIGVVMVYSASAPMAFERYGDPAYFLKRHLAYVAMGLAVALAVLWIDYLDLKRYTKWLLGLSVLLLILVLLPGISREIAGAKRWFRLGSFSFQPSELAKLTLILYMAELLSRKHADLKNFFAGFLPAMFVAGVCVGLILLQPDLGTAVAIAAVVFMIFFVAGIRLAHVLPFVVAAIPILYAMVFNVAYRRRRILAFLNPWADPEGSGFQMLQSYIALGSGGPWGVGLANSKQKLLYLPAAHTDFVFAIVGEEFGLIGTFLILGLLALVVWQGFRIAARAPDRFGRLLAVGLTSMIGLEALVNIGVNAGALPTKGLPLPFVSYGGSNLVFHLASIALLLNIARYRRVVVREIRDPGVPL